MATINLWTKVSETLMCLTHIAIGLLLVGLRVRDDIHCRKKNMNSNFKELSAAYAALGLSPGAPMSVVKQTRAKIALAFRDALASEHQGQAADRQGYEKKFTEANNGYDLLEEHFLHDHQEQGLCACRSEEARTESPRSAPHTEGTREWTREGGFGAELFGEGVRVVPLVEAIEEYLGFAGARRRAAAQPMASDAELRPIPGAEMETDLAVVMSLLLGRRVKVKAPVHSCEMGPHAPYHELGHDYTGPSGEFQLHHATYLLVVHVTPRLPEDHRDNPHMGYHIQKVIVPALQRQFPEIAAACRGSWSSQGTATQQLEASPAPSATKSGPPARIFVAPATKTGQVVLWNQIPDLTPDQPLPGDIDERDRALYQKLVQVFGPKLGVRTIGWRPSQEGPKSSGGPSRESISGGGQGEAEPRQLKGGSTSGPSREQLTADRTDFDRLFFPGRSKRQQSCV